MSPLIQKAGPFWNDVMQRYFFDIRDGDELIVDEEGMLLRDVEAAKEEAARSLADIAKEDVGEKFNGGAERQLTIVIRDSAGPVQEVSLIERDINRAGPQMTEVVIAAMRRKGRISFESGHGKAALSMKSGFSSSTITSHNDDGMILGRRSERHVKNIGEALDLTELRSLIPGEGAADLHGGDGPDS